MKIGTVLAFAFASICLASESHQASIDGYRLGEFAVKGTIEQQLNSSVVVPLSAEASKARGSQVEITVKGYADQIGGGAQNDRLAKSRAEEVAAFLSEKFPGARVVTLSKGYELNSRRVTVSWIVTRVIIQDKQQTRIVSLTLAASAGCLLILIVGAITMLRRNPEKVLIVQQEELPVVQTNANVLQMPAPKAITRVVKVEWEGSVYSMSVSQENGFWMTPFPTKSGDGYIPRKEIGDVTLSLKGYLKKPEKYRPMIDRLIKEGIIERKAVA